MMTGSEHHSACCCANCQHKAPRLSPTEAFANRVDLYKTSQKLLADFNFTNEEGVSPDDVLALALFLGGSILSEDD